MRNNILPAIYLGVASVLSTAALPVNIAYAQGAAVTQSDIDILEKKITELEARIERLERNRPQASSNLPSDEELDRTLNFMERFFQRFISIIKGLEDKEAPAETPQTPAGRT